MHQEDLIIRKREANYGSASVSARQNASRTAQNSIGLPYPHDARSARCKVLFVCYLSISIVVCYLVVNILFVCDRFVGNRCTHRGEWSLEILTFVNLFV